MEISKNNFVNCFFGVFSLRLLSFISSFQFFLEIEIQLILNSKIVRIYFIYSYIFQRIQLHNPIDDGLLKLPPIEKQFLISPPASPPIGWEQCREMAPVVCDFDLMARLAAFSMEDTYEVSFLMKYISFFLLKFSYFLF